MKPDPHTASLPLPPVDEEFTARDALALTPDLARKYSFEQAMAIPAVEICLRCRAEAERRARGIDPSSHV